MADEILIDANIRELWNGEIILFSANVVSGMISQANVRYSMQDYIYERFQVRLKKNGQMRLELYAYKGAANRDQLQPKEHAPWGDRTFTFEEAIEELRKNLQTILMNLLARYKDHQ
ncbi:MAG: hypothetical protein WC197_09220 [Candidatus Gastranaerophilaceae bacterium]|jgi:hypothetical protein